LPAQVWREAERATREAEVFLVVGTAAVVYPAAGLVPLAKAAGARVIEINLDQTPYSDDVDCSLRGRAGELLPELIA
jgi:NAD-dependent deacetylase